MVTDAALAQLLVESYSAEMDVVAGSDARCRFETIGTEFVVLVPGTITALGWMRDFEWWPLGDPQIGKCHTGFLLNGRALWAIAAPRIRAASLRGLSIVYAAHSLGGAEAQVMAAFHTLDGLPPCRVMTCGSPRVGLWVNATLRLLLHRASSVVLYKRAGDPVPHTPFAPWYLHFEANVIIGATMTGYAASFPLDPVNDVNHGIAYYAADLKAKGR